MLTVADGKRRTTLALTDEAAEILDANVTERKRGEAVSSALLQYFGEQPRGDGLLERIEARLERIEKQLAALQKAN